MAFKLDNVVPWGRNLEEYKLMFGFDDSDMSKKIWTIMFGHILKIWMSWSISVCRLCANFYQTTSRERKR